ncbi:MAG: indole-3-glycerol phosphate synthase [Candidatus Omnitrophica bacterium CG11_big_fil_rev_8_21_14_0_20_42_13]|uniref:Indole-3-glycerol phosphate synthase n=1 Tax=Candidatus Ghiorseimicrobium undicola TaxID=1974746 RepID=A0A2H0LYW5_9BACT|nr:MAG: indole-3-glycerol phosphate synthase [Candidatus Omnitrophica bacterium CG11_big_fil_rev_8_21_14_0_20_42_13]
MNILDKIIAEKKKEIGRVKKKMPQGLLIRQRGAIKINSFKQALKKKNKFGLIAEIKKASPSRGIIRNNFNPLEIAKIYKKAGADCLSVLTDEKFFKGRLDYIKDIKKSVKLPVLRKDFIIDEYQIYESRFYGADAVLLISSILSVKNLKKFLLLAKKLKLDCLVECGSASEIRKALSAGAEIIGINNRDLHNFKVDINRTRRLIKFIPKNKIIVSESGIKTGKDVNFLKKLGVDAVLIGEAFMRSKDIEKKAEELSI